ncbi:hypothetical protein QBC45DRAFT_393877 [Copromyces sp. CBS 386.78]|nr:hypothetical protein QBC45DRAFT_393877 [Copromyces sp. CBS 386.78]
MQQHDPQQQFNHGQQHQQGHQFPHHQNSMMMYGNHQMQMQMPPSPAMQHHQQAPHRGPPRRPRIFAQSFQESDIPQQFFGQQSQSHALPQQQQNGQVFHQPQQNGQVFHQPQQSQSQVAPQQQQNGQVFHQPQQQAMYPQQQAMYQEAQMMNWQQQQQQQAGAQPNLTNQSMNMDFNFNPHSLGDLDLQNFDFGGFDLGNVDLSNFDVNNLDFNNFGHLQGQQQQQNEIAQNAVNWPSENVFHGRNNSSVSLMTPPVDNSYGGGFVNSSPAQNAQNSFSNTPVTESLNTFNNSPGQISHDSFTNNPGENSFDNQASQVANHSRVNSSVALTPPADNSSGQANNNISLEQALLNAFSNSPVAESPNPSNTTPADISQSSPNTSINSAAEDFSAGSPSADALNSFNASPVQDSSAGYGVEVGHHNFGDLSGSFAPASENHQNWVDLTDDTVAFGQGSQAANYGQIDPFTSFASPAENHQQQALNLAQDNQFNVHQLQAFPNPPGVQSAQQYGSPHVPNTPSPAQQSCAPTTKKSTRKKAPLPKKPAAKRPAAKRAKKTKAPANNEQIANSEAVDNGDIADEDVNAYLWGAELQPHEYSYDLDESLRNFSDSVPQRNVPTMNGNLPAPAGNGIQNDPLVQFLDEENARLNAMPQQTKQKPQLTIAVDLEPPARSPPNKRKRGNSTATSAVTETAPAPKKRRVVAKRAKAKGSLSKSASSAKFGLGKGAGTGLNSPRTVYIFEDRAFYLIPAKIMPDFLAFVSTPREVPAPQPLATEQQQPAPVQQDAPYQQQPFDDQQLASEQQQSFVQQQPFDQQLSAPVLQPDSFQDDFEPAYDIEGRLLTLLQDDQVNEQNNDDDPFAPAPRRSPAPLSEAAIAFGLTSLSTEHSPASTLPVQNPPQASSFPSLAPEPEFPFSTPIKPFGSDLDENGNVIINPIPERSFRCMPDNREIVERFNLARVGSGTERDVSHLEYFIDLVHRSGLLACSHLEEIPGGFRWESWKTAEENLLALRPFFGTVTTRDWFLQWEAGENPVQLAEREEDE